MGERQSGLIRVWTDYTNEFRTHANFDVFDVIFRPEGRVAAAELTRERYHLDPTTALWVEIVHEEITRAPSHLRKYVDQRWRAQVQVFWDEPPTEGE